MKIFFLLPVVFVLALISCRNNDPVVMKIGPISVTKQEFEKAFEVSRLSDTSENRQLFMHQYVDKKLILIDAEQRGIDKDPIFLYDIQTLWEERLLKTALLIKFEEYAPVISASQEEVEKIYADSKGDQGLADDPQAAREQIRTMIVQEKQNQLLQEWLDALKKKTHIHIDERRLDFKK